VPWCETCDRFYNPNSLRADGTCPTCGRDVGRSAVATATAEDGAPATPWHFKVLLLATVVYLGWRLVEGVVWVAEHL
jgi:hypothetical protein